MSLGVLLHRSAERNPEKVALICGDETVTYTELDRSVTSLARWLLRQGLEPGDRVAIHGVNSIAVAKLLWGCFRAGLAAVTINSRLKAPEMAYMLEHSHSRVCFSLGDLSALAEAAAADCPALEHIYTALPPDELGGGPVLPEVKETAVALIIYTSGTTARPKGVTHTHQSLFHTAETVLEAGLDGEQVALLMTPLMHASGSTAQWVPGLLHGTTLVLMPSFEPGMVLDAVERHRCTFLIALPAMWQFLLAEQTRAPRDCNPR